MNAQSEAFVALAADEEHFAAVRQLAADFFALRDAMVNELDKMTERGKAAFWAADAKADATVVALKAVDEVDPSEGPAE